MQQAGRAFERGCGGLPQLAATSGRGKCEQSPQSSTLADEFLRAESRNVAILSYVADTSGLRDIDYGEILFEAKQSDVRVVRAFRPASEPLLLGSESAFSRRQTCFFVLQTAALLLSLTLPCTGYPRDGSNPRPPWAPRLARWMVCPGYGRGEIGLTLRKSPNIPSQLRRQMPQRW